MHIIVLDLLQQILKCYIGKGKMGVLWELGQVQIETCIESEVRKVTTEILV